MLTLADDAHSVFLLFNYGVFSGTDVIRWAEKRVAESDVPTDALLELTWTLPDNTADIISHLNSLMRGAGLCSAFKKVLGNVYDYVASNPNEAERISHRLLGTLVTMRNDRDASQFYFLYRIDDDFEDVYKERSAVLKCFLNELQKFAD